MTVADPPELLCDPRLAPVMLGGLGGNGRARAEGPKMGLLANFCA